MTLEGKIPRKSIDLLPESTEANEGKRDLKLIQFSNPAN